MFGCLLFTLIIILIIFVLLGYYYYTPTITPSSATKIQLQTIMNKLWIEHVMWTRLYILSTLYNVGSSDITANRLMQNQEDIGKSFGVFYGSSVGKKLTELLKEHINIAVQLIHALKTGDQLANDTLSIQWKNNADQIAHFLSSVSPYISHEHMKKMFNAHLDLTTQELLAIYYRDWGGDVKVYDKIVQQSLDMSRAVTDAICKQFNIN